MKFLIKTIDQKDPSKITEKEEHAANEAELVQMYKFLGYDIEIVETMGEPTRTENIIAPSAPRPGSGVVEDAPAGYSAPEHSRQFIPKPPEQVFTDGDTQFKVKDNVLYKKDWIEVDMSEYRIVNKKIQKLDWISLAQPEPEPEPEPEPDVPTPREIPKQEETKTMDIPLDKE